LHRYAPVDPRIVGGFTVAMGEDYYDLSLMVGTPYKSVKCS
jgi:hypothetical protein